MTDTHLQQGQTIAERLNPGLRDALSAKYDAMLPGMADSLIEWAYGHAYAREGLDLKTRQLCTVAALTALGGQTGPQLKVNIAHTLAAGASPREITEAIWQMAVYGGMPAAINGLNAAAEVFAEKGIAPDQG
ncbi:carboxymuconolactone decarboxylase family protein [Paracoccus aerodenitrificans]|uniref:carboxymuconolactone decarboxylase family protein n=1 Tax=Paracoccus aerodenitrificans TaxID=3017781 RepID=UPI0022F09EF0|nr:carboxymuconolactone decarboxylase family protein [Paracoccus aerodenitrificans]WBU65499.1 carboxymuconolactone decarboxylase family protein [Paracoccus aerodenitrificans]